MAIIKVKTGGITADAVTDALIADDVVGTEHLTANEVDTTALGADAVTGAQLADNAVNSEHYTDGSVDTAHIADANVTQGKIADQAINEAKMQISNAPTNGYFLSAQSGNTGGLTWATAGGDMTPAFSVYLSGNQSLSDSATTKIQFNTETLDTDSAFDTSNYDFTVPSGKGGKYFVHLRAYMYGSSNAAMFSLALHLKHTPSGGSQADYDGLRYYEQGGDLEVGRSGSVSGIINLGVGDKISGYTSVSTNGGSPNINQSGTHFCGYKIIE